MRDFLLLLILYSLITDVVQVGTHTTYMYVGLHCCWFAIMLCFPCKSCLRGLEFVCKAVLFCYFSKRWFQKCSWLTFRVFLTLLRLGSSSVGNILVNIGFKYIAVIYITKNHSMQVPTGSAFLDQVGLRSAVKPTELHLPRISSCEFIKYVLATQYRDFKIDKPQTLPTL